MPKATLPSTARGWIAALAASFAGFMAGFIVLSFLERKWR
jgi:hypothetical protein